MRLKNSCEVKELKFSKFSAHRFVHFHGSVSLDFGPLWVREGGVRIELFWAGRLEKWKVKVSRLLA